MFRFSYVLINKRTAQNAMTPSLNKNTDHNQPTHTQNKQQIKSHTKNDFSPPLLRPPSPPVPHTAFHHQDPMVDQHRVATLQIACESVRGGEADGVATVAVAVG